jgi:predicted lactoylglutathione lyase
MNVPRLTVVTLGVADLQRATSFYAALFGRDANPKHEEIAFFELPGTWLTLYPLDKLAEDISPDLSPARAAFSGITLAYNAHSRDEVQAIVEHARSLGATVAKAPQDTFWGGFSGYVGDLDGYHWEIVWAPMFGFTADGALRSTS